MSDSFSREKGSFLTDTSQEITCHVKESAVIARALRARDRHYKSKYGVLSGLDLEQIGQAFAAAHQAREVFGRVESGRQRLLRLIKDSHQAGFRNLLKDYARELREYIVEQDYAAKKKACADTKAIRKKHIQKLKLDTVRRALFRVAGIPEQYKSNYTYKVKADGTLHILFGGERPIRDSDDGGHGHVVLTSDLVIEYRRMPGEKRGVHNHTGPDVFALPQ